MWGYNVQCSSGHWGPIDKSFFCKRSLPYLHGLCYMYIYNLITQHLWIMIEHNHVTLFWVISELIEPKVLNKLEKFSFLKTQLLTFFTSWQFCSLWWLPFSLMLLPKTCKVHNFLELVSSLIFKVCLYCDAFYGLLNVLMSKQVIIT